jgi:CelD/BcsL family acetyltransferase involved in cellulose biosynthesis
MLRHLLAARDLPGTLALPLMPLEGPSYTALAEACRVTGSRLAAFERWRRPMLIPQAGDTAQSYLRRALGSAYKKRMQQFRAIARHGVVGFQRRRGKAAREALESFLTLEAAGWKGEAGTAIALIPADAAYFRTLADRFADVDGLQLDALTLDGAPIAMGLLIESAGARHFLKIAYDETQSRHSPGRALTIAMLQADFAGVPATVFDSGAGDGVDASTYIWGERREMGNVVVGLGRKRPALAELAAAARQNLRRIRARLKR